jgi:hypothetical protein
MATIIKYKWSFSELQIVITFEPRHQNWINFTHKIERINTNFEFSHQTV